MRHGGRILVDQLAINGVDTVFEVPGESFLAALDGLYDRNDIRTVVGRQEGGVAIMAEATGKLTGRPGVAFVTRGPGATNASAGVHIAMQDQTPMILFIGQVGRDARDRDSFQEVDYRRMFGPLAKWVAEIDDVRRIPEYVSHAFHVAMSGRPGPVVLALPEDMLAEASEVADALPAHRVEAKPSAEDIREVAERLARAQRPILLVGGGGWSQRAKEALERFAAAWQLPVANGFRCQDYMDNLHPCYAGDLGIGPEATLLRYFTDSDLVLAVGTRLDEMTTGDYTRLAPPVPRQPLVHVHPDPDEIGRVYRPELAVVAASTPFLEALADVPPPAARPWAAETERLHAAHRRWRFEPDPTPGELQLARVVRHVSDRLSEDAIVTSGAGNYAVWVHRYTCHRRFRTQLAPVSGSMGYGLPAAVAAKIRHPEREVVCFAGDGCFQMTMQEFGTAAQEGANILVLVVDNGIYATIRMHQERRYPERTIGTQMRNPDFAALARAYGGFGATVRHDDEFPDAFEEARRSGKPAILHLMVSPEALTPRLTLEQARAEGLARLRS